MPFSSVSKQICIKLDDLLAQLEEDQGALRLDILRDLAYHSYVNYVTEKMKSRLRTHCMTEDLIKTSLAPLFTHLHIEQYECNYDDKRNCHMSAEILFDFKSLAREAKKRKLNHQNECYVAKLSFRYSRRKVIEECANAQSGETLLSFDVTACLPNVMDSGKQQILHFQLVSSKEYPESFYQMPNEVISCNDKSSVDTDDEEQTCEDTLCPEEELERDDLDERVVAFELDTSFLKHLVSWNAACLKSKSTEEELDERDRIADVLQFLLVLPLYEDEWIIDERIMDLMEEIEDTSDSEYDAEDDTEHT